MSQSTLSGSRRLAHLAVAIGLALLGAVGGGLGGNVSSQAQQPGPCDPPNSNAIVCENAKPGNPATEWDVDGAGDESIQGFAADISVDQGQVIGFKIDTDATAYTIDIYRMGYYDGLGARKISTIAPSATLPQTQPACLSDELTGLVDCGNWAQSASWTVPVTAASGIYFAKLTRADTGGSSHIVFIVRDDDGHSDLLFQTSDTTWQAYNQYGGNSLYVGSPAGRAYKVSYNRPITVRGTAAEDWVFNAEYPMVRWLEANGYNVSYSTGVDSDRRGAEILEHKAFLSVGHDEYWSADQRGYVEAARAAGVHLAFFSGNEVFWKTRWENSIAPNATPHRTLVSYKETHANAKIDPVPNVWTGSWADPRFAASTDGGRPQNALTGQFFTVNCCTYAMEVPAAEGKMRFWRDTSIAGLASGEVATLPDGTLGYEWDEDIDNGFRPAGLIRLSNSLINADQRLTDWGSTYAPGLARHTMTLYRHSGGALVFGAGTVQWSWGLDGEHDRGASQPSRDMRQATVNLFADMGVQPKTIQTDLTQATPSTDSDGPVATITAPAPGTTVAQNNTVTVTGTASDVGGGTVAGIEVSFDNGSTWKRATGRSGWNYAWETGGPRTVTIRARGIDDSGNIGVASTPVSITVGSGTASCPCTIWNASAAPTNPAEPDTSALELGLKFRTSTAGYIAGVRFYKSSDNTGEHIASLWTRTGQLLDTVTFTSESSSGWQQVEFASPVEVAANTTYVVSYHTNSGFYAQDAGYFQEGGIANGPLTALAHGVDGGNGVFKYGSSGFPSSESDGSNYWVDVVFVTSVGPDTVAPTVKTRTPAPGATAVAAGTAVKVVFSERLAPATVTASTIQLRGPGSVLVNGTVAWDAASRAATFTPAASLTYSSGYAVTVVGGTSGVKDLAGNALATDSTWSFTTAGPPPPPPTEGPGGPILVVASPANPFSRYYAEILRAEGLNSFEVRDVTAVTAQSLSSFDVVVLGEMPLTAGQVTMFSNWVSSGGNLIAMRPDKQLANLLGLSDAGTTLAEGYLRISTGTAPGAGLVGETIQFHGTADRYAAGGGTSTVASLYSNATAATGNPAVTLRSVGSAGGNAVAFTYDLAKSVVYTRQGNPLWAGQDRDGLAPVRSDDLFFGGSQPDYVDLTRVAIPQADEQQRLLANIVNYINSDRKPLPRFWYLPRGLKAAVVMTGDDHAHNGTSPQFDGFRAVSPAGCSVADWQCVRATSYLFPNTPISDAQIAFYQNEGFEIGVHMRMSGPLTDQMQCNDYTPASVDADYTEQIAQFRANFPSTNPIVTNRTHCIVWSDYSSQAEVAVAHGVRLDTNYYWWPASWVNDRPGLFTGSGMPMRFAKANGTIIDAYQAPTQITDESGQTYSLHANTLLDNALGPLGYYAVITANMHTDAPTHAGADAIITAAQARSVPVVSAAQMLEWLDGRNGSSFGSLNWFANRLDFTIAIGAGARGLQVLLPADSSGGSLASLVHEGVSVPFTVQQIKGVRYAVFAADAGAFTALYAPDTTAPAISAIDAKTTASAATITWSTSEPATSSVDYGLAPGALTQTATAPGLLNAHSVTFGGLSSGTLYYYRVRSADASGNTATGPTPPGTFVTADFAVIDTTVADFSAGTIDSTLQVNQAGDGEVLLRPALDAEFSGASLPAGWSVTPWTTGGVATVSSGAVSVSGARLDHDGLLGRPQTLEFAATFTNSPQQHAGFGITLNETPWAIFSTGTGGTLYARTHNGAGSIDTPLPGTWLGSPHVFRIQWLAASVIYSIDGSVVATHDLSITAAMRPLVSDLFTTDAPLVIDWIRAQPYAATGTFVSRVLDGGSTRTWRSMTWTAEGLENGSLSMSVRFGNTPVPDASWTGFAPVFQSGGTANGTSRYAQYRSVFNGNTTATPILLDVAIGVAAPLPDTLPPSVSGVSANAAARSAIISWTTSEPATSSVSYGVSPTSLNLSASVPGTSTSHAVPLTGLYEGVTYYYRVTSADALGNATTYPASPATFTTGVTPPLSLTDTTVADFSQGAFDAALAVTQTDDGEVVLTAEVSEQFSGSALPAGWSAAPWTGGGAGVVSGGSIAVDGALVSLDATVAPERSLQFRGIFSNGGFQHVGFALTFNESLWAIFSTGSGGSLLARTNNGSAIDTPIAGNWLNAPHDFRIDWLTDSVRFWIDGQVVATHAVAITPSMRPVFSDAIVGDGSLAVDSLQLSPYAPQGMFTSRVLDGQTAQDWTQLLAIATTPAGTSVNIEARFGDSPAPDASWTTFTLVNGSGALAATSRFAQYRATLISDGLSTPVLHSVTIAAPAPPPSVSVIDTTVGESATGTSASVVVQLSRASTQPVTVAFTTANGSATAGSDYAAASGTATFAAGVTSQTIPVVITGDTTYEPDEAFALILSSPANATLGRARADITIANDDPVPVVSIGDVAVTEGNAGTSPATFAIRLSNPSSQTITVAYATSAGSASAGTDFIAASGTVTLAPGETQRNVTVSVLGDSLNEADETFYVSLTNPVNATLGPTTAIGTIVNDDAQTPAISIAGASVTEGNTGTANTSVTVSLSFASSQQVTVGYATANGTATAGSDFTAASGSVVFAPGETSKVVALSVVGDTTFESNETFTVNLSNPANAAIAQGAASVTIVNDDAAPRLAVNTVSLTEGDSGSVNAQFAVTLSGATALPATVNFATANGTAVAGTDYTAASGTLTFAAGETSKVVTVAILGDTIAENTETFTINLSAPANATITTAQGTGTITDNDRAALSINNVTVAEPTLLGSATFTVTLNPANPTQTVTVSYATSSGTATADQDYLSTSGTLTFAPGATSRTFSVTTLGDSRDEADETFLVTLTNPVNAALGTAQGIGTVVDNDATPSLSINNATVTEGNTGTIPATFTVSLSAASGQTVTVGYATANGTAVAPQDYIAASGTLAFAAGETSKTIAVAVVGDTFDEANEVFTVVLSSPTNATIADNQGTGTITDNDATPTLAIGNVSVTEGNTGTVNAAFSVTLSAVSGQAVSVNYATAAGTAASGTDFTATSGTLTIPAGSASGTVSVPVIGDVIDEPNETFVVNLTGVVNATIADAQGVGTIVDNDPVSLQIADVSVNEGTGGSVSATFTVSLSATVSQTVTVNYATANGTALAGSDYTAVSGTLSFPAGTTSRTFTVAILGDALDEDNETFAVNLSSAVNAALGDSQAVGTIVDNDATPSLSIANLSGPEGNSGSVTGPVAVTLSAPSGRTVTVNYATANGPATAGQDYVAASGTLTFPPGSTSQSFNVTVIGDTLDEADETAFVNLNGAVNATIADNQAVGTIVDDDPSPTMTINNVTVTEGNTGSVAAVFTVSLSTVSGRAVTVGYATANGTATSGADYTGVSGTLSIPAGSLTGAISVPVLGDTADEVTEGFVVNLSGAVGATITDTQGAATITDNDNPPAISINNVATTEGDSGTKTLTFTVSLSAASGQSVSVNYATANGTATSGTSGTADYVATSGTLTFTAGQTSRTFTVTIRGDNTREASETFAVNLTTAVNATITDTQGIGTITNDD